MIDAAEHERRPLRHQGLEGQQDAIGRRAVHLPGAVGAPHRAERSGHGQRMGLGALFPVRRDHGDMPDGLACLGQDLEPRREDAVIVRDEDVHAGR